MAAQTQARLSPYPAYRAPLSASPAPSPSSFRLHIDEPLQQQQQQPALRSPTQISPDSQNLLYAYMNPLPPPQAQQTFQLSPHHGIKRSAPDLEDELERSSHISSQFKKLRLHNRPAPNVVQAHSLSNNVHQNDAHVHPRSSHSSNHAIPQSNTPVPALPSNDVMTLDDTPSRVYITDLESEIASIEAAERAEASQLFLPDFEKQIGAVPDHVLRSSTMPPAQAESGNSERPNQALVLYKDPTSISVPVEEDAVRKAILEARRGIRERMRKEQQRERETANLSLANAFNPGVGASGHQDMRGRGGGDMAEDGDDIIADGDAMDIE